MPAASSRTTSLAPKAPATKPAQTLFSRSSFKWRQLESPDFPTFIQNLRGVGCPEATIRDIIQGEIHEIYEAKRVAAQSQSPTQRGSSAGGYGGLSATDVFRGEESALLTALMSGTSSMAPLAGQAGTPPLTQQAATGTASAMQTAPQDATMIPASFLVGNHPAEATPTQSLSLQPTDPQLNTATASAIEGVRTEFAKSMESANPSDQRSYRQNWLAAQRANDEFFASMFGGDTFIQAQTAAMQKSAAAAPATNTKR